MKLSATVLLLGLPTSLALICHSSRCSAQYKYQKKRIEWNLTFPFMHVRWDDTPYKWCVEVDSGAMFFPSIGELEFWDDDRIVFEGSIKNGVNCADRKDIHGTCYIDDNFADSQRTHRCTACSDFHHKDQDKCENNPGKDGGLECKWYQGFLGCYDKGDCDAFTASGETHCNRLDPGTCKWVNNQCVSDPCNDHHFKENQCKSDAKCTWYPSFTGCYTKTRCDHFTASGATHCNAFNPGVCAWKSGRCDLV